MGISSLFKKESENMATPLQSVLNSAKNNVASQQKAYQNNDNTKLANKMIGATIGDISKKYGFNFSREYAQRQAAVEAQAQRNTYKDSIRKNDATNRQTLESIHNNLSDGNKALDTSYFQQYQGQRQNQTNRGLNAGLAADQNLRLNMNQQGQMADMYRDASLARNTESQRYAIEAQRLAESLGLVDAQEKSKAEQMYQDLLTKGYGFLNQERQTGLQIDSNEWGKMQDRINNTFRLSDMEADTKWKEYTFNNMTATERAQFEQNAYQFGEEMAWRMYELEYGGTLQKSLAEAQLNAYTGFNGGGEGGEYYGQYKISSPYGMRKDPYTGKTVMHKGIDIAMPTGAKIPSTVPGKVVYAGFGKTGSGYGGYGNVVVVKDANGNLHQYAHLNNINVKVGQTVDAGTNLGGAGSTGRSTGPHLDYMVKNSKGVAINPTGFLQGSSASSSNNGAPGYKTFKSHLNTAIKRGGIPSNWSTGLEALVKKESSFNYKAQNPNSSAYGYGQFINSTRQAYEKKTGLNYNDPVNQLIIMAKYVKDRYGTPAAALAFHKKNNWY
jgi:murein DD-endopeptidase MepM/ murein hydrolase activator NlpD